MLSFIFVLAMFFVPEVASLSKVPFSLNFQDKIDEARDSFEDIYYDLVKNGHFKDDYPHNLIISTNIDYDFTKNGMTLLGLIEYLQKRDDFDSQFLLIKLNDFLCLKLHRFISKMDAPKKLQGDIWTSFYALYEHCIDIHPSATEVAPVKRFNPFRTTLTKAIITMYLIFFSELNYDQQKESLVYFLEKIKNELVNINRSLVEQSVELGIDGVYIADFVKVLETYALADQLVQPRSVKRIILISLAITMVVALAVVIIFKVAPNLPKSWDDIKAKVRELTQEIAGTAGRFLGDALFDAFERKMVARQQDIQAGAAQLATTLGNNLVTVAENKLTANQAVIQNEVKGLGAAIAEGVTTGMTPIVQQQADQFRQQAAEMRRTAQEEIRGLAEAAGRGAREGFLPKWLGGKK